MNTTDATSASNSTAWFVPSLVRSLKRAVDEQAHLQHRLAALHYFVSPYAAVCMLMAVILNRTVVFASSRRHSTTSPQWPKTLLRLIAIVITINNLWLVVMQFTTIYPAFNDLLEPVLPKTLKPLPSLLWSVFICLCCSQFLETFVSITSGQSPSNDTGLTLFEHSLAFQECQSMSRASPQLLIICCFSLVTQLTTHVVGLLNYKKFQFIPSTILGIAFLAFYCITIYTGATVYLPSVVLASVFPQLLVLVIAVFCVALYGFAVLVNGVDTSGLTYTPMIRNLRTSLNLQLNDDFNSTLMRFGFIMFTAVENKEYVNELSDLTLARGTYLDQHHLVSGYFNKVDNNPELVHMIHDKSAAEESIFKNWNMVRKFANMGRLIQALFLFVFDVIRKKPQELQEIQARAPSAKISQAVASLVDLESDDLDDLEDFELHSESDFDPLDFYSEDESESYIPTLALARKGEFLQQSSTPHPSPLEELFAPTDLLDMLTLTDSTEASFVTTIKNHILMDKRLTRTEYCALNKDDLLKEVIHQVRPHNQSHEQDDSDRVSCVVCQTEPRSVVLWPCKCFSLCESCRVSLGVRGFGICVCCRAKVDGYSKLFIP